MKKKAKPLTAKQRADIPASKFGLPKQRAYPMEDKSHARNAKARASQALKAGKISRAEFDKVIKKADKVIAGSASAAAKKGLKTSAQIAKTSKPAKGKKVQSVASRVGTRKVVKGRTVTAKKRSKR